ncbi:MAG: hypothetical protein ACOX8B_08655 [Lachnospiraceae bacterium]|jgi:hypothetical protein
MSDNKQDPAEKALSGRIENVARNVIDQNNEENAKAADGAGLETKIVRTMHGETCKWCAEKAGTYEYDPKMNRDVFRRHDNCDCSVDYICEKGRQDVWSKKWKERGSSERNDRADLDIGISRELYRENRREKELRIEANKRISEQKQYDELLADVSRFYYNREQSALEQIRDTVRYDVGILPKSDKSKLLDGSKVFIEGQSLKRILKKHGNEFSYSEFKLLKKTIEFPDCIASNESHHESSLLLYKRIPGKSKVIMECAFIKQNDNYIIHYHKIGIKKIKKLNNEGKVLDNRILDVL